MQGQVLEVCRGYVKLYWGYAHYVGLGKVYVYVIVTYVVTYIGHGYLGYARVMQAYVRAIYVVRRYIGGIQAYIGANIIGVILQAYGRAM